METAVILIECPDCKGIIAKVSDFLFKNGANIIQSDQYSTDPEGGTFFMRIEFYFDPKQLPADKLEKGFGALSSQIKAQWKIYYLSRKMRMGMLVSKEGHCLADILYRSLSGEINVEIPCVVSNHEDHRDYVERMGMKYHFVPASKQAKKDPEKEILRLVKKQTDFLVLARYMQILTANFLISYGKDIINIHHSFLPSFKGANPYKQAYNRGVKVIGATAHYVTENLDEGPIIEQIVEKVTHRDNVESLKRKGRNLEKVALANAVSAQIEHRVIRHKNKTVLFA